MDDKNNKNSKWIQRNDLRITSISNCNSLSITCNEQILLSNINTDSIPIMSYRKKDTLIIEPFSIKSMSNYILIFFYIRLHYGGTWSWNVVHGCTYPWTMARNMKIPTGSIYIVMNLHNSMLYFFIENSNSVHSNCVLWRTNCKSWVHVFQPWFCTKKF